MKLFAPEYYKNFKCIADKCTHSCCIGWEIDIDSDTLELYNAHSEGYYTAINGSIEGSPDGSSHFRLCAKERCPHLTEEGLCRIICELGEECLCDICHEHPRFYNFNAHGAEVGLGAACEEACRLILECENYTSLTEIGELDGESEECSFDAFAEREKIYSLLSQGDIPYSKRLEALWEYSAAAPSSKTDEESRALLSSLEYLDDSHRELFAHYSSRLCENATAARLSERFLAYLIYRHTAGAKDEQNFRAALSFCFFCERLFFSLLEMGELCDTPSAVLVASTISEELEYSEDNTDMIKLELLFRLK